MNHWSSSLTLEATLLGPSRHNISIRLLIYRIISIGFYAKSFFSKLFCFGFASAIFLYIFVNISMVLGLLPIVGAPLPIMSYGGSSMLSIMLGLSIVMSCKIYSQDQISNY